LTFQTVQKKLKEVLQKEHEKYISAAHEIDDEIRHIIDTNYDRAESILKEKVEILHAMSKALMKDETIDQTQIAALMKGEVPSPPEDWSDDDSPDLEGGDGGSTVEVEVSDKGVDDDKGAVGDPAG